MSMADESPGAQVRCETPRGETVVATVVTRRHSGTINGGLRVKVQARGTEWVVDEDDVAYL